jgi:hypothetical protein
MRFLFFESFMAELLEGIRIGSALLRSRARALHDQSENRGAPIG